MARTSSEEKDALQEMEDIGENLQSKKQTSEAELREAYQKYLDKEKGYTSQAKVVKTIGSSMGVVSRAFLRFKAEGESFHVEGSKEDEVIEATTVEEDHPHPMYGCDCELCVKARSGESVEDKEEESFYIEDGDLGELEKQSLQELENESTYSVGIQLLKFTDLDNERYQPRAAIAAGDDLLNDIMLRRGNIYPVLVQRSRMAVVDGHRRWDAIRRLNEDDYEILIKCDVQDMTDQEAALLAYQANVLSSPLSEGERDKWIHRLMSEFNISIRNLQLKTGLAENTLRNIQRAFEKTTDAVKERLESGMISTGVAKAIASLPPAHQTRIVKKAVTKQLSVRDVEDEARTIRGREAAREKLVKFFEEKELASRIIELKRDRQSFGDPKRDWANKIITECFGSTWHRENDHMVDYADVVAATKKTNITITILEPKLVLCELCFFNTRNKCAAPVGEVKGYPKRTECDMYVPTDDRQRWTPRTCSICGELNVGFNEELTHDGDHRVCRVKKICGPETLTGLCESCGNPCGIIANILDFQGKKIRRVHVSQCTQYEKAPDLQGMVAKSIAFAEELVTRAQEHREIVKNKEAAAKAAEEEEDSA